MVALVQDWTLILLGSTPRDEDDQGDDPHLDVDIDEKPGKNTIGKKLLIFLVKSKLATAKQDGSASF